MSRRPHLLVSFSVLLATVILSSGCGEDVQATPRVTFDGSISAGKHSPAECGQSASPWFKIGSFGSPSLGRVNPEDPDSPLKVPSNPIEDGAAFEQGEVAVSCRVAEDGDAFAVELQSILSGATGGAVTIKGKVLRTGDSPDIYVSMARRGEGFASSKCTITFNSLLGHGVAAGRVWGFVECPDAEAPSQGRVCKTNGEFRFENCGQ